MLDDNGNRPIPKNFSPALWWDPECDQAVTSRRAALREYVNHSTFENLDHYELIAIETSTLLKRKKKDGWKYFCNSLSPSMSFDKMWRAIKGLKNRALNPPQMSNDDNDSVNDPKLMEAFDKISHNHDNQHMEFNWNYNWDNSPVLNDPITLEEVEVAIEKSKTKSAPGLDNISYETIRHFPPLAKIWLRDFFNLTLSKSKTPSEWKKYKVCFISKPNRSGYRPIAMSSCISKILERIVNDRLMWWVESKNLIPENFCGFRRGKSCYDNLANFRLDLDIVRLQGLNMGAVFIDIEGAYDNVNIQTLTAIPIRIEIPPSIVKYILESFSDRVLEGYSGCSKMPR